MKRRDKLRQTPLRVIGPRSAPGPSRETALGYLVQVHPVPQSRDEVLMVAIHFARRFAAVYGKAVPGFSEDAATFLARHRWEITDLAVRVSRAVAANQGNLITSADLCGS